MTPIFLLLLFLVPISLFSDVYSNYYEPVYRNASSNKVDFPDYQSYSYEESNNRYSITWGQQLYDGWFYTSLDNNFRMFIPNYTTSISVHGSRVGSVGGVYGFMSFDYEPKVYNPDSPYLQNVNSVSSFITEDNIIYGGGSEYKSDMDNPSQLPFDDSEHPTYMHYLLDHYTLYYAGTTALKAVHTDIPESIYDSGFNKWLYFRTDKRWHEGSKSASRSASRATSSYVGNVSDDFTRTLADTGLGNNYSFSGIPFPIALSSMKYLNSDTLGDDCGTFKIFTYDSDAWEIYSSEQSESYDKSEIQYDLSSGQGFVIQTTKACTLDFSYFYEQYKNALDDQTSDSLDEGITISEDNSLGLSSGWTLVTIPFPVDAINPTDIMGDECSDSTIFKYDEDLAEWEYHVVESAESESFTMEYGRAYWMHANNDSCQLNLEILRTAVESVYQSDIAAQCGTQAPEESEITLCTTYFDVGDSINFEFFECDTVIRGYCDYLASDEEKSKYCGINPVTGCSVVNDFTSDSASSASLSSSSSSQTVSGSSSSYHPYDILACEDDISSDDTCEAILLAQCSEYGTEKDYCLSSSQLNTSYWSSSSRSSSSSSSKKSSSSSSSSLSSSTSSSYHPYDILACEDDISYRDTCEEILLAQCKEYGTEKEYCTSTTQLDTSYWSTTTSSVTVSSSSKSSSSSSQKSSSSKSSSSIYSSYSYSSLSDCDAMKNRYTEPDYDYLTGDYEDALTTILMSVSVWLDVDKVDRYVRYQEETHTSLSSWCSECSLCHYPNMYLRQGAIFQTMYFTALSAMGYATSEISDIDEISKYEYYLETNDEIRDLFDTVLDYTKDDSPIKSTIQSFKENFVYADEEDYQDFYDQLLTYKSSMLEDSSDYKRAYRDAFIYFIQISVEKTAQLKNLCYYVKHFGSRGDDSDICTHYVTAEPWNPPPASYE